jgi:segregation and condensation protein B
MATEDVVEANQEERTTSHEEVSEKLADQPESPESSVDTQASHEVVAASEAEQAAEQRDAQPSISGEEAQQGPQLTAEQKVGLLEALLLASGDPLPISRVEELLACQKADVLALAETLKQSYAAENRGLELVNVSSKLQLRTKALYAEYVRNLIAVKPRKLSQAALETLAIIAYQQPVVKSEVDKIRGVDVAPTIKTLLERKLVKILGYQPSVGQPALYGTTEDFLSIFGLTSLAELPSLRDLKALVKEPGEALEVAESDDNSEDSEGSEEGSMESDASPETQSTENTAPVQ